VSHAPSRVRFPGCPLAVLGRTLCGLAGLVFLAVLVTATRIDPDPRGYGTHEQLGLSPCGFHLVFNIPCPSCGATTSFAHFVRGQWRSAMTTNAGAFALAFVSLLAAPWLLASAVGGRLWFINEPFQVFFGVGVALTVIALSHWLIRIVHSTGRFAG